MSFIDALGAFQVLFPLIDIVGKCMAGAIRPFLLKATDDPTATGSDRVALPSLHGVIGGVPVTLRIQNELYPHERDNGAHVPFRITAASERGDLLLANPHGPVIWSPRLRMPLWYNSVVAPLDAPAAELGAASSEYVHGPLPMPTQLDVVARDWPAAVARSLLEFRQSILAGEGSMLRGQYHLAVTQLTAMATGATGPPVLRGPSGRTATP